MNDDWDVEVFFDGECPLCMREINFLRRRDRQGRIRFTDIAAPEFDPGAIGLSSDTLMGRIHGRLPGGELIQGVEVFRRLYTAVGMGKLVALSRLPGISTLADGVYSVFAANRLRLTGRCVGDVCGAPSAASPAHRPQG